MNYVVCFIKIFSLKSKNFTSIILKYFFDWIFETATDVFTWLIMFWINIANIIIAMFWIFFLNKLIEEFNCFLILISFSVFDISEIADIFETEIDNFVKFKNCEKSNVFFSFEWNKKSDIFFFVRTFKNSNNSKNETNKTKLIKIFNFWTRKFEIFKIEFFKRIRNLNKFNNCSKFQFLIFFLCWFSKT